MNDSYQSIATKAPILLVLDFQAEVHKRIPPKGSMTVPKKHKTVDKMESRQYLDSSVGIQVQYLLSSIPVISIALAEMEKHTLPVILSTHTCCPTITITTKSIPAQSYPIKNNKSKHTQTAEY